ncbi:MAG TPA: hypothetical protein VMS76_16915, partial [Planctomycetota bacterium]|nr:hypothetical protein [Planctomycetota bacterium]
MRPLARPAAKDLVIAASLAAAALVLVARVLVPWLAQGETYTDGERTFEVGGADAIRYAVWDEPRSLGVVGASRPALSPDGRWLAFSSGEVGLNAELYLAEIAGGELGEALPIAVLNSESDEIAPAFGDGALYFASNRAGGAGGFDLYRAAWDGSGFGPPLPMDALNGEGDDVDPAPVPGTAALVFATDRSGRGDFDLWLAAPDADGAGWDVSELAELNTRFEEREPALAAGGRALVFASDREGTRGGFDLWRSLQEHGLWLAPRQLEGLCGADSERGPALAASGFEILFAREASGVSELLSARSLELLRRPPRPASWIDLALAAALLLLALLAWLAKRWEELDVLYKALLASVLVHLLLLLWFRYLHPESDVREAPRREPTFQIRPIPPAPEPSAIAERAGALELERGASAGPREPDRLAPESSSIPREAPEAAALARASAE